MPSATPRRFAESQSPICYDEGNVLSVLLVDDAVNKLHVQFLMVLASFVSFSLCAFDSLAAQESKTATLENDRLRIVVSRTDGRVLQLENLATEQSLITHPNQQAPFAILLGEPLQLTSQFTEFQLQEKADELCLSWKTELEIEFQATIQLKADRIEFRSHAVNTGQRIILGTRFPAIGGIGKLSPSGDADHLLHSTMMGALFHNPFELFDKESTHPFGRGMTASRYPNGFHGSATQLMAYYQDDVGGFYFAIEDGQYTDKDLNFFKTDSDSLAAEFAHFNWNAVEGGSVKIDYPVIVSGLTEGNWYEAADRYRDWATKQVWCSRGTREERLARKDASDWLLTEIGAVGMWWPFREDLGDLPKRTRDLYQAPLLHLELWWQNEESVANARVEGDKFGPFYFPYLALKTRDTFKRLSHAMVQPPGFSISPDWIIMCAADQDWRQVFVEMAGDMAGNQALQHEPIWMDENRGGCDADCLYFDIGPCAGIPTHCYDKNHGHVPGAGRQITASHIRLVEDSQKTASRIRQRYVPIGTEVISEPFLSAFDLYYPRNAGFTVDMENAAYVRQLTWLPDGKMEVVPLFAYIYNQYAGVPVQGVHAVEPWSVRDGDDFHAWAETRAFLWGGVTTTFAFPEGTRFPEWRIELLRSLVEARTGFAKDYLVFGQMLPPPKFEDPKVQLDHGLGANGWLRKLRFPADGKLAPEVVQQWTGNETAEDKEAENEETAANAGRSNELSVEKWIADMVALPAPVAETQFLTVDAIQLQAFGYNNKVAIALVNLQPEPISIEFEIPIHRYNLASDFQWRLLDGSVAPIAGPSTAVGNKVSIQIPPRKLVLLEMGVDL